MNPTPTRGSALTGTKLIVLRMITVLWVEDEGARVGAYFLLFESAAYGDIIGLRGRTHVWRSKRSWAGGGSSEALEVFLSFEEAEPTVYTRSPSSRAKAMFSKKDKNAVHPRKHVWRRMKERRLDERRRVEARSDASLQQVGLGKQLLSPQASSNDAALLEQ